MLTGAMNHPGCDVVQEIEWMADLGLDFIDLTLEPPLAAVGQVDLGKIRSALVRHGLKVVGHTAYYLPVASPFESIRRAAVEELKLCLQAFAALGAAWMNLHPDRHAPFHERSVVIERNLLSVRELLPLSRELGVGLMVENLPGHFNTVGQLSQLLEPIPELGLHLDIGHANLMVEENTTNEILAVYAKRLQHVHLHDNKGGMADLHLPLGVGNLNLPNHIRALRGSGYDGTITLEVFSCDREYLAHSRDVLFELWNDKDGKAHWWTTREQTVA